MKNKIACLLALLSASFLVACGTKTASNSTEEDTSSSTDTENTDDSTSTDDEVSTLNEVDLDYDSFASSYGEFSLMCGDEEIEGVDGVYTINVASSKLTYTASGYLEGRIVVANGNSVSSYKGVTLELSNAFIVNDDEPSIDYTLEDKNIEIVTVSSTTNYIVNTSSTNDDGQAINSLNNVEMVLNSESDLYLYTVHGHTIKADGDVKITGSGSVYLSSGHDGVHCHNFTTYNNGSFSGYFEISNAISQGIEASTSSGSGTLKITGGTFVIRNCESVFKVDKTITISGGKVTATGIWSDPFVRGSDGTLTITISDSASVTVNGESVGSQQI
ncbi:MAG: carbohydrate-binding domain-containing protein [Bacilli bacterium]|nr:carbohydrate-binding domain-containing protein [Bacilli bacterium]